MFVGYLFKRNIGVTLAIEISKNNVADSDTAKQNIPPPKCKRYKDF